MSDDKRNDIKNSEDLLDFLLAKDWHEEGSYSGLSDSKEKAAAAISSKWLCRDWEAAVAQESFPEKAIAFEETEDNPDICKVVINGKVAGAVVSLQSKKVRARLSGEVKFVWYVNVL